MIRKKKEPKKKIILDALSKSERLKLRKKILASVLTPKIKKKDLAKECYNLWVQCIKEHAGWKSELSGTIGQVGKTGKIIGLDAHHIAGKANHWLRFELDNGICLVSTKEHIYGVHSRDPLISNGFMQRIIKHIGFDRWNRLCELRNKPGRPDLHEVKKYLTIKLEEIKNEKNICYTPTECRI